MRALVKSRCSCAPPGVVQTLPPVLDKGQTSTRTFCRISGAIKAQSAVSSSQELSLWQSLSVNSFLGLCVHAGL